jgi:hypothetical protein
MLRFAGVQAAMPARLAIVVEVAEQPGSFMSWSSGSK